MSSINNLPSSSVREGLAPSSAVQNQALRTTRFQSRVSGFTADELCDRVNAITLEDLSAQLGAISLVQPRAVESRPPQVLVFRPNEPSSTAGEVGALRDQGRSSSSLSVQDLAARASSAVLGALATPPCSPEEVSVDLCKVAAEISISQEQVAAAMAELEKMRSPSSKPLLQDDEGDPDLAVKVVAALADLQDERSVNGDLKCLSPQIRRKLVELSEMSGSVSPRSQRTPPSGRAAPSGLGTETTDTISEAAAPACASAVGNLMRTVTLPTLRQVERLQDPSDITVGVVPSSNSDESRRVLSRSQTVSQLGAPRHSKPKKSRLLKLVRASVKFLANLHLGRDKKSSSDKDDSSSKKE